LFSFPLKKRLGIIFDESRDEFVYATFRRSWLKVRVRKVPLHFVLNDPIPIPWFSYISYKYLILSEKGTNPLLILDTRYTYRGCGLKMLDLSSEN